MLPRSLIAVPLAAWVLLCAGCAPSKPAPKYPLKASCPMCGGSGRMMEQVDSKTQREADCPECDGTGERPAYPWEKRIPCEPCKSAGQVGGVECAACEGLGWKPEYDLKLMGADDGKMGRVFDGSRIRNWWQKPKPMIDGARKGIGGLFGLPALPARIIQAITIAVAGLCGLCCAGLGLLAFVAMLWAGVRIYQGRPA